MPEPTTAAGFIASKLFPPLMGLAGAVVSLSYMPELSKRQWGTALTIGVFGAYLITPVASAYLRYSFSMDWLPNDGSIEGLIGLMIGMCGIHIVGGLTALGRKFAKDPLGILKQIRFGSKNND